MREFMNSHESIRRLVAKVKTEKSVECGSLVASYDPLYYGIVLTDPVRSDRIPSLLISDVELMLFDRKDLPEGAIELRER